MRLVFSILLTLLFINLNAQSWVDLMLDPNISFYKTQDAFNKAQDEDSSGRIKGFKQFKRWEHFMESRVDSDGFFRNQDAANKVYNQLISNLKGAKGAAGNWTQIGPFGSPTDGGSGRTNCITFHPTDANIILVGSASGGIWRSVNGGATWATNTDGLENLGVSDIVFSQSNPNIVYAATGDRDAGDTYSIGILKSIDGGLTWNPTGMSYTPDAKRKIYKILVHPTNDSIIFAASTTGLRKSTDGGVNWIQMRAGSFVDMKFKPSDPNTIYAATATVVIRTTDGGLTWNTLTIPFASANRRLIIGVSAADANFVYILAVKSTDDGFGGIFKSIDGGNTFSSQATSPNILGWESDGSDAGGQGWYDLAFDVSPTNPNLLLVGGINIWRSLNGGTNWTLSGHWTGSGAPYVHADIHEIRFSPHSSTTVWACTDGGLSASTANGSNWVEKNTNLSIAQMYRMGGSAQNANKILSGWQDNGTNYMNSTNWSRVLGGDGMECLIDFSNQNYMYGSLYYGYIRRSTNGGSSWTTISDDIPEEGAWVTPFVQDPNNAATLLAGYKNVYKTTNRGNSWVKISNFGSTLNINALTIAPSNSNIIIAGNDSYLWKTTDGGSTWTNITNVAFGVQNITSIAIHNTNPNKIWVTLSGFTNGYKVYHSNDGGSSWTNISGNLPNLPANTIIFEKNTAEGLYVGMDVGVYYRDTILGDWIPFMLNMPNVIVKELEFFAAGQKIRAATYGRGLWESPVYALANSLKNMNNDDFESIIISPNPTNGLINLYIKNNYFDNSKIEVIDATGKTIRLLTISNTDNYKLDLSNETKGIYIIRIQNKETIITKKVVLN